MRAFVFDRYRKPVHLADIAEPVVGDNDVLIAVEAAGVNHLDAKIRDGGLKQIVPYVLPHALGHDVAGTVLRTGSAVTTFSPGDAVYARAADGRIGTFAERISLDRSDIAPRPTSIGAIEAASLPLVALTAWQALVETADVRPGQKVLIHAGAGGVGSIAIQLAKHLGARVATTASAANADFVRDLGADVVIDYRARDFAEVLSKYDLVLDTLGGTTLNRSLRVLAPGGLAIGLVGPPDPAFAKAVGLNPVLRLGIAALSARVRLAARRRRVRYEFLFMTANGAQLRTIAALVDEGILRPIVGRTFPFAETPAALNALAAGGFRGKIVVVGDPAATQPRQAGSPVTP